MADRLDHLQKDFKQMDDDLADLHNRFGVTDARSRENSERIQTLEYDIKSIKHNQEEIFAQLQTLTADHQPSNLIDLDQDSTTTLTKDDVQYSLSHMI